MSGHERLVTREQMKIIDIPFAQSKEKESWLLPRLGWVELQETVLASSEVRPRATDNDRSQGVNQRRGACPSPRIHGSPNVTLGERDELHLRKQATDSRTVLPEAKMPTRPKAVCEATRPRYSLRHVLRRALPAEKRMREHGCLHRQGRLLLSSKGGCYSARSFLA